MNTHRTAPRANSSSKNNIILLVTVIISSVFFIQNNGYAAERSSYSSETVNQQSALDKKSFVEPLLQEAPALLTNENQQSLNSNAVVYLTGNSLFTISSAQVSLIHDDDFDGYYSGIRLSFDADVAATSALVFARLYIRYEHGPWNLYFTTKTFDIFGDSSFDVKTVETSLSTGYPPGAYDILIELFEAGINFETHVASYGPDNSAILDYLLLEDEGYDFHNPEPYPAAGCSLSENSKFDPVLPLLFLISLIYFGRRYNKIKLVTK